MPERSRTGRSGTLEAQHVQEAPARHGQQPRQRAMQRHAAAPGDRRISRVSTGTVGKMPRRSISRKPARARQVEILADRPIARMLGGIRRANQAAAAGGSARATAGARGSAPSRTARRPARSRGSSSASARGWSVERQVLEHVEAQRAIERRRRRTAAPSATAAARAPSCSSDRALRSRRRSWNSSTSTPSPQPASSTRVPAGSAREVAAHARPASRDRSGRTPSRARAGGGSRRAPRIPPSARRKREGA